MATKLKALVDLIDDVPEQFRELYSERSGKFELTGVEGMKTEGDVNRLQTALTKERGEHKAVRERLALLGDRKIEDVLTQLDRIPELETAAKGKLDEKELDSIVEARAKSRVAPVERERGQLANRVKELETLVQGYQGKEKARAIHDAVRAATSSLTGFLPSAVDDALVFAERMLDIDENGKVVTRDGVGVTPGVDAVVWLTEMQPKKGHWWGPSSGGGSRGNPGSSGSGLNPWSHEGWNLTEQGKIVQQDHARAEQLARSAGSSIGGLRPSKK